MTDEQIKQRSRDLREAVEGAGGKIIMEHISDEMREGWESFIALPVAQKTSKAAFNHQARYEVLKNFKEWLDSEIRVGEDFHNP